MPVLVFLAWTPVAHAWSWPLRGPVLHPFVYDDAHPYAAGQHRGIDIGADDAGESVVAPAAGTVSFAGSVPTSGESVTIETSDGYSVTLTHLGSITVSKGATVAEGSAVGAVGPSGTPEVDGPYVHLGIRVTADQNGYVDPLSLLPAPTAEPPPADDSAASQPGVSGGATTVTPPATEPAPIAAPSAPPATTSAGSTRVSTLRPGRVHRATDHGRSSAQTRRPEAQRPRSSRRPAVPAQPSAAAVPTHAASPARRMSEPAEAVHRPVVESATRGKPTSDAGEELPSAQVARRPRPQTRPQPQPSADLFPLVCNGTAALIAVSAALAAARRRRHRASTSPIARAQVLRLPSPAFDWRQRDAA